MYFNKSHSGSLLTVLALTNKNESDWFFKKKPHTGKLDTWNIYIKYSQTQLSNVVMTKMFLHCFFHPINKKHQTRCGWLYFPSIFYDSIQQNGMSHLKFRKVNIDWCFISLSLPTATHTYSTHEACKETWVFFPYVVRMLQFCPPFKCTDFIKCIRGLWITL